MAIEYSVRIENKAARYGLTNYRKRLDSAKLLAERMTYDWLADNGLLDTKSGHQVMNSIKYGIKNSPSGFSQPLGYGATLTFTKRKGD